MATVQVYITTPGAEWTAIVEAARQEAAADYVRWVDIVRFEADRDLAWLARTEAEMPQRVAYRSLWENTPAIAAVHPVAAEDASPRAGQLRQLGGGINDTTSGESAGE